MNLDSFEKELRALIGRPTTLRPFVCDGSPLTCTVFLVGLNPATSLNTDFWSFWESGRGFAKARWYESYLADRADKPLKPGKKIRLKVSPTRRNIDAFVEGAGDVRVLETNIYASASADLRSLEHKDRETTPFEFLLESIRPKVIVVHGKPAIEEITRLNFPSRVIAADSHFSRGTSKETARKLGARAAMMTLFPNALS